MANFIFLYRSILFHTKLFELFYWNQIRDCPWTWIVGQFRIFSWPIGICWPIHGIAIFDEIPPFTSQIVAKWIRQSYTSFIHSLNFVGGFYWPLSKPVAMIIAFFGLPWFRSRNISLYYKENESAFDRWKSINTY